MSAGAQSEQDQVGPCRRASSKAENTLGGGEQANRGQMREHGLKELSVGCIGFIYRTVRAARPERSTVSAKSRGCSPRVWSALLCVKFDGEPRTLPDLRDECHLPPMTSKQAVAQHQAEAAPSTASSPPPAIKGREQPRLLFGAMPAPCRRRGIRKHPAGAGSQ